MEYSIGQIADKFGVSIHTLRYYEKEGILPAIQRTDSGLRRFDEQAVEELRVVECLKKTGMPLKEIRRFQDWAQAGDETLAKRSELFKERRRMVLKQIAELQSTLDLIEFKAWYYEKAAEMGSEQTLLEMDPKNIPEEIKQLYIKTHR